jgi:hypothetical protein
MDIAIQVNAEAVDLSTPIGERPIQVGEDEWIRDAVTLGDAVAERIANRLMREEEYRPLKQRVLEIRDNEVREQVKPVVARAIEASVQPTNSYGQPTGEPVTLTDVIVREAKELLNKRSDYGRGPTFLEGVIRDAVGVALQKELAAAIAEEKAKVVAVIRAKAAELIAEAIKAGVGR